MKIIKNICCVFISLGLLLSMFTFSVSAVGSVIQWDGKDNMISGNTYVVTNKLYLNQSVTIPKGVKLSIREGGSLYITQKAKLTVNGAFTVSNKGYAINSGEIVISKEGVFDIYGVFESSVNANIHIHNKWTIFNTAKVTISSTVLLYQTANLYIRGYGAFTKSSSVTSSGIITLEQSAQLHIQGKMGITKNATLKSKGYISIGSIGSLINSGSVTFEKEANYNRFGTFTNTKSGKFLDYRPISLYQKQTVGILVDEPRIIKKGIDVSQWQGDIDWAQVKAAGIDFAMIRAARGKTSTSDIGMDTKFEANVKGAIQNDIHVGVYFYSYATTVDEIKEEARYLVRTLKNHSITYPVVLDVEEEFHNGIPKKQLTEMIDAFFKIIMDEGYFPMLYSYKSWIEQNLDMVTLDKYAIWLAQVNDKVTYDGAYYMWQYSHTGKVKGIKGDVDLNYSYRDFAAILKKYHLNKL